MAQPTRHDRILDIVKRKGFVMTDDLAQQMDVSPQTIRRDLNHLGKHGKILRHHGGASLISSTENVNYTQRKVMYLAEKKRIATKVASHIPDGASIFLDIGTTSEAIAQALLDHKELRIVTNNLNVAATLISRPDFKVVIAGGEVRNRDAGIIGEQTCDFISQFRLDFGIVTCSGIDDDGSLLDFDYHEARIAQAIITHSRSVYLPTDHSKFGRSAMVDLAKIKQFDILFCNQMVPEPIQRYMEQHEVEFQLCN